LTISQTSCDSFSIKKVFENKNIGSINAIIVHIDNNNDYFENKFQQSNNFVSNANENSINNDKFNNKFNDELSNDKFTNNNEIMLIQFQFFEKKIIQDILQYIRNDANSTNYKNKKKINKNSSSPSSLQNENFLNSKNSKNLNSTTTSMDFEKLFNDFEVFEVLTLTIQDSNVLFNALMDVY
jgi:hypothetical protein